VLFFLAFYSLQVYKSTFWFVIFFSSLLLSRI